jgi:hypothetical protein
MLRAGGIAFRGSADALSASEDAYLRAFLAGTIAASGEHGHEAVTAPGVNAGPFPQPGKEI